MHHPLRAFFIGGFGCLVLFIGLGIIGLMVRGSMPTPWDILSSTVLSLSVLLTAATTLGWAAGLGVVFALGGLVGIAVNAIYQKGRRDDGNSGG
ncbi:MAG: hypothetical protein HS117_07750 [Verrucomicrobiaceae bacterium]|nr:hypothetical protein [Verrucomicrobiaceae bacterium]